MLESLEIGVTLDGHGVEAVGRKGALRVGGLDFEAVAAPTHRHLDLARLRGAHVDRTVRHPAGDLDGLVVPAAVLPIPLIFGLDAQELPFQPFRGDLHPAPLPFAPGLGLVARTLCRQCRGTRWATQCRTTPPSRGVTRSS